MFEGKNIIFFQILTEGKLYGIIWILKIGSGILG